MLSPHFLIIALMILGITWNFILVTIPCLLAYEIAHWRGSKIIFRTAFLMWLFFFPNTAYMFTLVRHLVDYCNDYNIHNVCFAEAWKIPLIFLYALLGLPTFVYSLRTVTKIIHPRLPLAVIPLTSLGILFGLWERVNTWDIVAHPLLLIQKTFNYFSRPVTLFNWLVFTLVLFIIYYGTLYLWNQRKK